MSQRINQPVQSIKLTNVAVVRMNRHGKRFEIACYRNKVVNYRQGLETDVDEVLQTDRVFVNVSKGQFASSALLKEVFDTTNEMEVAHFILQKGTLQISDLERSQNYENTWREVSNWVSSHCVHPTSQRPYTPSQIRQAMKQVEFHVHPTHSTKKQYLSCVKLLQSSPKGISIERAKMELLLSFDETHHQQVVDFVQQECKVVPSTSSSPTQVTVLVDPSLYRPIDTFVKSIPTARLEISRQVVTQEGDVNLEDEMERRKNAEQAATASAETVAAASTNNNNNNDEDYALSTLLEEQLTIDPNNTTTKKNASDPNNSDDEGEGVSPAPITTYQTMRKSQKKKQKQSKKAKRREKEEALERQARIDKELKRQEERQQQLQQQDGAPTQADSSNTTTTTKSGSSAAAQTCNTCGGSFMTPASYRAHFKSDWHRYNIKLKMKGVTPVSEQEFILCDSDAFFEDMM